MRINKALSKLYHRFYTLLIRNVFKSCDKDAMICGLRRLIGPEFILIGKSKIGKDVILTAYKIDPYRTPVIEIGDECNIGEYCHITAVDNIKIGNGVLTGRWVTISDNSHGSTSYEDMVLPPLKRKIVSKGNIVIGNNVWIGDKATILAGVTIGEGSVIGANSVVTHDIPAFCVACGNPAKIVKQLNTEHDV